ncbi:DUF2157 domain-containing protein [Paraglaciecola marina]|uniref:DUF2157 domain-containing protein n=1 Tax=Paraglaciecola marina TaxID=2500157 RepID=UPI00105EBCF9|nr:DUF2157 domain-containing protein [Paraglaciecola marina]
MIDDKAAGTRQLFIELIESKELAMKDVPEAIAIAKISPSAGQWQNFINTLLLWFGSLTLAFGVIFFVAANWQEVGRMVKFAIVEGAILIAMILNMKFRHKEVIRQATLLIVIILVGALMALFGQTYQTGADPWQLFLNWALLTTPWVLISRFSVIWLIWLGLLNLSISLYYQTFGGYFNIAWVAFGFNTAALVIWQGSVSKFSWLNMTWAINLLGFISGALALNLFVRSLFNDEPSGLIVWGLWAGFTFYVYRYRILNLFMLAVWSVAILVAANALLIRILPGFFEAGTLMLLTIVTIGLGTYFTVWLKSLNKVNHA